jgi:hypothetical protein
MAVWYNMWSFGLFFRFGMFGPRKIWQPWMPPAVSCGMKASKLYDDKLVRKRAVTIAHLQVD